MGFGNPFFLALAVLGFVWLVVIYRLMIGRDRRNFIRQFGFDPREWPRRRFHSDRVDYTLGYLARQIDAAEVKMATDLENEDLRLEAALRRAEFRRARRLAANYGFPVRGEHFEYKYAAQ